MKPTLFYINEALRIKSGAKNIAVFSKGNQPKKYFPTEREELIRIIGEKYAENEVEIDVSDIDTSGINNFSNVFSRLDNLKYIHGLNTWDMSKATTLASMFYCCYELNELDLTGWDVRSVKNMLRLFSGCHKLHTIKGLETWDTSKCTSFQEMFYYCTQLTKFNINDWNVTSLITAFQMFVGCAKLQKQLDLTKWEIGKQSNCFRFATEMFENCRNLITIGDISNWNLSDVENAARMFRGCECLQTLGDIGKWNFKHCYNCSGMFEGCGLLQADVSNWKITPGTVTTKMFFKVNTKIFKKCKLR